MGHETPSIDSLMQAPVLAASGAVRRGGAEDAIDDVTPRLVVEPGTAEDLAGILAWASQERLAVVLRGGGTKMGWGRRPSPIDLMLSLRRLNRVVAHEYADMTATIQAGAPLEAVDRELARHGQCLAVDSAFEGTTVGGAIATNDSGPRRHRYGTPRDLLIGIRLATADGRLVKAGGNVVKNVAGYDIGRLMCGSFGTLAAIVSATFKLVPLPRASSTVVARFDRPEALVAAVTAVATSQLDPTSFDLHAGGSVYELLVRFTSAPAATDAQIAQARTLIGPAAGTVLTGREEAGCWRDQVRRVWDAPGVVVKAGWLPAALPDVLALLDDLQRGGGSAELVGRAGLGSGLFRVEGEASVQLAAIARLRSESNLLRHVAVLRCPAGMKGAVDVWGPLGGAGTLGLAVKRVFDPAGILNAGRGPI